MSKEVYVPPSTRSWDLSSKPQRRQFLSEIRSLVTKKPINYAELIDLFNTTYSFGQVKMTLRKALIAAQDATGLFELVQIIKELIQQEGSDVYLSQLFAYMTDHVELYDRAPPKDPPAYSLNSSQSEELPTIAPEEYAASLHTMGLQNSKLIAALQETIILFLQKGMHIQLAYDIFITAYSLLDLVPRRWDNEKKKIVNELSSQITLLNNLLQNNFIDANFIYENRLLIFIQNAVKVVGFSGNKDGAIALQKLIQQLATVLPEESFVTEIRCLLENVLNSRQLTDEDRLDFIVFLIKNDFLNASHFDLIINKANDLDYRTLVTRYNSVKSLRNSEIIKVAIKVKIINNSLAHGLSFSSTSHTLRYLEELLKSKMSAQSKYLVLKNLDNLNLYNAVEFYLKDNGSIHNNLPEVYFQIIETLVGHIGAESILDLIIVHARHEFVSMINFSTPYRLPKYVSFILNLWREYSQDVLNSNGKAQPIERLLTLLSAQYYCRHHRLSANLLQHLIRNNETKSLTSIMQILQNYLLSGAANSYVVEKIFDLIVTSSISGTHRAYANCNAHAMHSPYVMGANYDVYATQMRVILKTILQNGLLDEPRKKLLNFLGGMTEHLTSISKPRDNMLTQIVANTLDVLYLGLEKQILTVPDCLEIIFVPATNHQFATILDFSAKYNKDSLMEIFKFLKKVKAHHDFNIDPYVQQVENSAVLSPQQKSEFKTLYQSVFGTPSIAASENRPSIAPAPVSEGIVPNLNW